MADFRMPDMNKVFLAGRLTRKPELRYLQSGTAVCEFGLAVSRKYRGKDGEMTEEVVFVDVTCWAKTAEYAGENFAKGWPVMVEGRLKSDKWETREGEKRTKLVVTAERVQALDWEKEGPSRGGEEQRGSEDVPKADIPF